MNSKQCSVCKLIKPLEDFHKSSRIICGKNSSCKQCKRLDYKRRYLQRVKNRLCTNCNSKLSLSDGLRCPICVQKGIIKAKKRMPKILLRGRQAHARAKLEAFEAYGGVKCACLGCNISTIQMLTLDHVNNDGNKDRKRPELKGGSRKFYKYLKRKGYPKGLQVLCFNCNIGRYINGGKCPLHQKENI